MPSRYIAQAVCAHRRQKEERKVQYEILKKQQNEIRTVCPDD